MAGGGGQPASLLCGTLGRSLRANPEVLGQLPGAGVKHPLMPEAGHAGCDTCESAQQRSLGRE